MNTTIDTVTTKHPSITTGPARRIASEVRRSHARGFTSASAATSLYLALAAVADDVVRAECLEAAWRISPELVTRRVTRDGRWFFTGGAS